MTKRRLFIDFLGSEGAVFISDIVDALELPEKDVESALIELGLGWFGDQ